MGKEWVPTGATYSDSNGPQWNSRDIRSHSHNEVEISVILEGSGNFTCGSHTQLVKEGSICWISPSFEHTFRRTSSIMRFATIHIQDLPLHLKDLFPSSASRVGAYVGQLSKSTVRQFESTVETCAKLEQTADNDPLRLHLRNSSVDILIAYLSQNSGTNNSTLLSITDIAAMLRLNASEEWEIGHLAKLSGTSESHFRRLFKEVYGLSPKQYQQNWRHEVAMSLLATTDKKIDQIATSVGFESISAFSTWFRKLHCKSPTEWRETARKTQPDTVIVKQTH